MIDNEDGTERPLFVELLSCDLCGVECTAYVSGERDIDGRPHRLLFCGDCMHGEATVENFNQCVKELIFRDPGELKAGHA